MKNLTNCLVFSFFLLSAQCKYDDTNNEHLFKCHEGLVIGKIRSWGGGVAVSLNDTELSSHKWNGFDNVVEVLNVPDSLWTRGKKIFILARPATESEKQYPISADGDESAKPIVYATNLSTKNCSYNEN